MPAMHNYGIFYIPTCIIRYYCILYHSFHNHTDSCPANIFIKSCYECHNNIIILQIYTCILQKCSFFPSYELHVLLDMFHLVIRRRFFTLNVDFSISVFLFRRNTDIHNINCIILFKNDMGRLQI